MEYSALLGNFVEDPINREEPVVIGSNPKVYEPEFIRPRLGIPMGFIDPVEHKDDIEKVVNATIKRGYRITIPHSINRKLRLHLEHFRNHLEIYDILIKDKVFSVSELWFRSLTEQSDFTKFIKKSRAGSLQRKIALEETEVSERYGHSEYKGYDSIFHETFFPYWDDSGPIEDYLYSFIPSERCPSVLPFLEDMTIDYEIELKRPKVHFLQPIAGKKTIGSDDVTKTTLLKNAWHLSDTGGEYYAHRVVVPTAPGQTRDSAVADVTTLNAVKICNSAARKYSEELPFSANCSQPLLHARIARMRRCRVFLHVDFKKFGLTSPRAVINTVLSYFGLDNLRISKFYLEVDGEVLQTERGSALGWMDPVTAIGVIGILYHLRKREKWSDMDFIVFNDDVEIGFRKLHSLEELALRKDIILRELESFDFILSHRKIFYSKMMIFLENYFQGGDIPTGMNKNQLVCKLYAKSLSTPFKWKAKAMHAEAHKKVRNSVVTEICMNSIASRSEAEESSPVELGGWKFKIDGEKIGDRPLNLAIHEATCEEMSYFVRMSRYREPHLAPKKEIVNLYDLYHKIEHKKLESIKLHFSSIRSRLEMDTSEILSDHEREALRLSVGWQSPSDELTVDPKTGIDVDPG